MREREQRLRMQKGIISVRIVLVHVLHSLLVCYAGMLHF